MTCIKEILDRTMSKMAQNTNYVAYEIMNKDPLNENSVEYLNGQQELWTENYKERHMLMEQRLAELNRQYSDIKIGFCQTNFDKHIKTYYVIQDLKREKLTLNDFPSHNESTKSIAMKKSLSTMEFQLNMSAKTDKNDPFKKKSFAERRE